MLVPFSYRAPFVSPTLLHTHKSNLYLTNSLAAAVSEPALYRLLTFHVPNLMSFSFCNSYQSIRPGPRHVLVNKASFYGEDLSAPRPTPKLDDHPLSAVRDCLFSIFATTIHIGGRSSIRNLRTRHAVVTGTNLSRTEDYVCVLQRTV